ncbi:MAG: hypothetical protein AAFX85_00880 [Pseudomonadota bacterium]
MRPPDQPLLDKLAPYPGAVQRAALEARATLLTHAPTCWELLYSTRVVSTAFSLTPELRDGFCHVAVYSHHVNLGFNRGAELSDPEHWLQGTGKVIRHVRLDKSLERLRDPYLATLIEAALDRAHQRLGERGGVPVEGSLLVK